MADINQLKEFTTQELQQELANRVKIRNSAILHRTIEVVGNKYCVKPTQIFAKSRRKDIQLSRNICYYIINVHYKFNLEYTASVLKKISHATIMNGKKRVLQKMEKDHEFKELINQIIIEINIKN